MKSPGTQRILHNTSPKVGEHELNNNDVREVLQELEVEQYVLQDDDGDKKPWGKSKPLLKLLMVATVLSCCDLLLICLEFCQFFPLSIFSP